MRGCLSSLVDVANRQKYKRRDGQWFTVNNGDPTFTRLKKGDIIFNHKQTADLFEHGYVTGSHARAYASGTVLSGPAHSTTGKITKPTTKVKKYDKTTPTTPTTKDTKATPTTKDTKTDKTTNNTEKKDPQEFDWIETLRNRLSRLFENLKTLADYYTTFTYQNREIEKAIIRARKNITANEKAADKYLTEAQKALDPLKKKDKSAANAVWNKIQNGTLRIEEISNEDTAKAVQKAQELYEKYLDCKDAADALNTEIRELSQQKLDNIIDDFEALTGYASQAIETLDARITYRDTSMGKYSIKERNLRDISDLRQEAKYQNDIREEASQYAKYYEQQIASSLKKGEYKVGSQQWVEAKTQLNNLKQQAYEAANAINEINQRIFELNWSGFDNVTAALDNAEEQLDHTISLISDLNAYSNKTAAINSNGITLFNLYASNLANARQEILEYNNAINKLYEAFKKNQLSQDDYNEKMAELKDGYRDATKSAKDYRDSIIDLIKKGIQAETSAMQTLINKQKEQLKRTKEADDYARTIRDKTKERNKIQAQINAIEGDTTLEAQAKRQQLEAELREKDQDIEDAQRDHQYNERVKALEDEMTKFKEIQDEKTNILETDLYKQGAAIQSALKYTTTQIGTTTDELTRIATVYGIELEKSVVEPWKNATNSAREYGEAVHAIEGLNRAGNWSGTYHTPQAEITTSGAYSQPKDPTKTTNGINDKLVESNAPKNNDSKPVNAVMTDKPGKVYYANGKRLTLTNIDGSKETGSVWYGEKLTATGSTLNGRMEVKTASGQTGWIKGDGVTSALQKSTLSESKALYNAGNSKAKKVATISKGTKVTFTGAVNGNYRQVTYKDANGKTQTGWIKTEVKAKLLGVGTISSTKNLVPAVSKKVGDFYKNTTKKAIPIRAKDDWQSKQLSTLPIGAQVKIQKTSKNDKWGYVSYGGKKGWIDTTGMTKVEDKTGKSYKTTTSLPLRPTASAKQNAIATVPANTKLQIISTDLNGKWVKVKYNNKTGWLDSTSMKKAAHGARNASGLYLTDEQGIGSEMLITKSGVLRQLDSDTVFSKQQTDMLWNLSKLSLSNLKGLTPAVQPNVTMNYGSLLTVQGNVDRDALPGLQEILKQACDYTKRDLKTTFRKMGVNGSF